jgi:hypothetical protein
LKTDTQFLIVPRHTLSKTIIKPTRFCCGREGSSVVQILMRVHVYIIAVGNHEYYTGDVDNWIMEIPKLNVTPLINERVCLSKLTMANKVNCEGGLYLAGLEDLATRTLR